MTIVNKTFAVGSIVRAKKGSKRCRAMIATIGGSGGAIETNIPTPLCLLWEPIYPQKISSKFLITPKSINSEAEQEEVTVGVDAVEGLLPFEDDPCSNELETSIATWKDRGDQLLRLGDVSAAASFYEKALSDSSLVSIGGSVVISVEGFPRIAEVDCSDEDDGTIDVTLVHNGDEATVPESSILLGLLEPDLDLLQERILLNLARCMLQLADLDAVNRPKYLKSSVLATTLAITLSLFRQEDNESLPTNAETALMLRCKAYSSLSKWSKATADAKKLIKSGGGSAKEQGQKLLAGIERKKKIQFKKDKKLAKDICRLVQSATDANEEEHRNNNGSVSSEVVSSSCSNETKRQEKNDDCQAQASAESRSLPIQSLILGFFSTYFIVALAIALISVFVGKTTGFALYSN